MPSVLQRGPITTHLIGVLEDEGFPVGDNASPVDEHGWQGEPNAEDITFIPWMVLTPGTSTAQSIPGAMGDTGTEWRASYSVFHAGLSRKQTEALADKIRQAFVNLARTAVITDQGNWKFQKVTCVAIGTSNRIGSAYPDHFAQTDTYEVWITKE